ncbi:MAG: CZB domain-containing protein [Planctomycetes bacterium]|nr:CZB domain-containing protein [Planctomycetota bacterium]
MTTTLKDQITAAIGAHALWKGRLIAAIANGNSEYDPANVEPDHRCEFGKWLYTGLGAESRGGPEFTQVKDLHARFHKEAARILRLAVGGKKEEARSLLQGDYARISTELVQKLGEWKRKG